MRPAAATCLWLLITTAATPAAAGSADFDTWLREDLVPYVRVQLADLPRFHNQSFRFVVIEGDRVQSDGSELAMDVRNTLRDAMADVPGIRIVWQAGQGGALVPAAGHPDCTRGESDYFIGVELQEFDPGSIEVRVRALDIEEQSFVTDFNRAWRGNVDGARRQQLRRIVPDPGFRGERNAPWNVSETDLMAAHLAYQLGCGLLGQTAGEYVLGRITTSGDDSSGALVELVGNNLAHMRALKIAPDDDSVNAAIEGKAHRIDDDLYQYWISIAPLDGEGDMTTLTVDTYVRIPDRYQAAALLPESAFALSRETGGGFLSSLHVVRLPDQSACDARPRMYSNAFDAAAGNEHCFALQVGTATDAVVFFLNHQLNHGLVRLAGADCTRNAAARIARTGEDLRHALPLDTLRSGEWSAASRWPVEPRQDAYYVLASSDTRAARALSAHVKMLPARCAAAMRNGLEGDELYGWLEELEAIVARFAPEIDWRSIRVKDLL